MNDIRYVILHAPGPAWVPDKSLFEQDGVREQIRPWMIGMKR